MRSTGDIANMSKGICVYGKLPSPARQGLLAVALVLFLSAPLHAQTGEDDRAREEQEHQHSTHEISDQAPTCAGQPGKSGHDKGMMSCSCPSMHEGMGMGMCPMMQMRHPIESSWGSKKGQLAVIFAHSSVPGIPGASHLYHIGRSGFFVNHGDLLELSKEQKMELNRMREQAVLDRARSRAAVRSMELDLWQMIGADKPNMSDIETKIRAIEKARADSRINYLRAVEAAAKVLSDQQRSVLLMGDGKADARKGILSESVSEEDDEEDGLVP